MSRNDERVAFRIFDGEVEEVYLRKCHHCNCWFGTPWYWDTYCCPGCQDAPARREKNFRGRTRVVRER